MKAPPNMTECGGPAKCTQPRRIKAYLVNVLSLDIASETGKQLNSRLRPSFCILPDST